MKQKFYPATTVARAKAAASKSRTAQRKTAGKGVRSPLMAKEDRSQSLRNEIEELREEAAALADVLKVKPPEKETKKTGTKHSKKNRA
jgi:hypothetical protein